VTRPYEDVGDKYRAPEAPWCGAAGEHLADQLLLPFALAGGGAFTAEKLNLHSRTNMEIIRCFLPVDFVTTQEGNLVKLEVKP
jgi:RNA 3'-terminal phosphate cyclase (ATP)